MGKYSFEEIIFKDNQIIKQNPQKIQPSQDKVAIIAHVFYVDLWQEIKGYLEELDFDYDLYISVPHIMPEIELKELFSDNIEKKVYMCENRGRDVLPFLLILNHIGIDSYKYICKLHTKKTGSSPLGNVWRKLLYFDLLEKESAKGSVELLDTNQKIGQITGRNTILDSKRYAYRNNSKIKELCNMLNIEFKEDYYFCGGTMFWSRSEIIEPLVKLLKEGKLEFEEERGQKDHTLAHAIERFFGILTQNMGKIIAPSPSDYSKLPRQTIEETASLVLSQQYAGQDIIDKMHQDRLELEALAESMRIKNRLKRLPSSIANFIKKKLFFFSNFLNNFELKSFTKKLKKLKKINPASFKKVLYYLKRGEFKYLASKVIEKVKNNLFSNKDIVNIDLNDYFEEPKRITYSNLGKEPIDIIIPVYNGY